MKTDTFVMLAFLASFTVYLSSAGPQNAHAGSQMPLCEPTSGRLDARSTLAGREGTYLLTLAQVADGVDARRVQGFLYLRRQPAGLETLEAASTPLYGSTDVDLRAVGAHRVGDPASTDPEAPGVLVLESVHAGGRRILLRLGSHANRRDAALFDGAYTVLEVHGIADDGFYGGWRSGARSSRKAGYFCARRMEKKAGARVAPRLD